MVSVPVSPYLPVAKTNMIEAMTRLYKDTITKISTLKKHPCCKGQLIRVDIIMGHHTWDENLRV